MKEYTAPTHIIDLNEKIYRIHICAGDFAPSLVCLTGDKKLILGEVKFPEETEHEVFTWTRLKDLYFETSCPAVCFSPESSLISLPKPEITFCAAGADFKLRIFRTDLGINDTVQTLTGHSNFINDIAWDTKGEYLASVSDDYTCKIWYAESNYNVTTIFCLSSSGVSVKWHPEEPQKVLVAEKKGIIRLYNLQKRQAVLSIETQKAPLTSVDWSENNRLHVTALVGGDIVTWDLTRSATPTDVKEVHGRGGKMICSSPSIELVTASVGAPSCTLKIFTAESKVPIIEFKLKLFYKHGMCWHHQLPYIAVVEDRKLLFWKVQLK